MKTKEYKALTAEDLKQKEGNFRKELFDLRYQRKMGTLEKPARIRLVKRDIAKILTILRERELDNERNTTKTK